MSFFERIKGLTGQTDADTFPKSREKKYDMPDAEDSGQPDPVEKKEDQAVYRDRIRGCLMGGAAGDALGNPVEFIKIDAIQQQYGEKGITSYVADKKTGMAVITDDTQMTLFTAVGMLEADKKWKQGEKCPAVSGIYDAYLDWLITQETIYGQKKDEVAGHRLMDVPELYAKRAPGITCLSALGELRDQGNNGYKDIYIKRNDSKGCGGIMRVAPLAFHLTRGNDLRVLDREAAEAAMVTHCHSLGYMPAAVFVHIINRIVFPQKEMTLEEIVIEARNTIAALYKGDENLPILVSIINRAMKMAANDKDDVTNIHSLGGGWIGEEALGIAIYCALRYRNDFSAGIIAAVNHNGDSDSTGAVTGNILGAICGYEAIEDKWKKDLELRELILQIADELTDG